MTSDNNPSVPFGRLAPNAAQAALIALAQRTGLKRGAFRPWLSRLLNLFRAGPLDVKYQGAAFRFYHQGSATERGALLNPDYNIDELRFLRAHVTQGGVFIDVGANVGTYALAMARDVGENGKVIAIEPHPVTHARLAFNHAAILEEASVARVDALKIDVEGYEDQVLVPFFKQAPQALWPRAVVIEHLSKDEWQGDCIADMLARGYAIAGKTRSNTLLLRG